MPDGEPDLESLTMAFFETRDAGNLYYLQGYTGEAGMDNADFATPPDGQSGHMRMFLWDYTNVRPPSPPSSLLMFYSRDGTEH